MKPFISIVSPVFCKLMSVVIDVSAITLWPFVISRYEMSEATEQHEGIHAVQQLEMAVLFTTITAVLTVMTGWWPLLLWPWIPYIGPYYLMYGGFWLWGMAAYGDKDLAYYQIPFEQEAYAHQKTFGYFEHRRLFSWIRFRV